MKLTEIIVHQTIPAPATKIFGVWMDPNSPGGPWFGAERVILNPGGGWSVLLRGQARGTDLVPLRQISPDRSPVPIEYTWMSEAPKGSSPL